MGNTSTMTKEERRVLKTIEYFFTQKHDHSYSIFEGNKVKIRREGFNTFLVFDYLSEKVYDFLNDTTNRYWVGITYRGTYEVTLLENIEITV